MNENKYNPNSLLNRLKFLGAMATIFAGALLIILALFTYFNGVTSVSKLDDQSQKISELVQQNKDLTQQAKDNAKRAANYAYCNILLISKYSQDQRPFTVEDANKCVTTSFDANTAPLTQQSTINSQTPVAQTTPKTQTTTPSQSSTPAPTQSTSPTTSNTPTVSRDPLLDIDKTNLTPGVHLTLPCLNLLFGAVTAC